MSAVLSIVTPAYNAEGVIDRAVQSIVPQLTENVEWIIVDDGSTDEGGALLDSLAASYRQIRVIHTKNRGAGAARNIGIREARGEWIVFLDADDYLADAAIADIISVGAHAGKVVDIIYLPKIMSNMKGDEFQVVYPETKIQDGLPEIEFWSSVYRLQYLKERKVYFPEYREQDVETAFRLLAFNRTNRVNIQRHPIFLVHRDNPISNVHTWSPERLLRVKSIVYSNLIEELSDAPLNVRKKIVGTLYTCVDQYVIGLIRGGICPSCEQLGVVLGLGKDALKKPCSGKTWMKKILFIMLEPIALMKKRK